MGDQCAQWTLGFSSAAGRVATNLENSGNLENCQNHRENLGKLEFL